MAMIGTYDDDAVVVETAAFDRAQQFAEPRIDHGQLGAVAGAHLPRLPLAQHALAGRPGDVRRPDQMRSAPLGVVHRGVRLGSTERLVRIEFVDEQHEALVRGRRLGEPSRGRRPRTRGREVRLVAEISARVIVRSMAAAERRRAEPAWIGPRLPGVAFVAAQVVPGAEIGMVVLAANLEQVWMVRDQLGGDARRAEIAGQGLFPEFDRAPWLPQEG